MNEIKIHIPDELVASVNTDGSLVTIEERDPEFEDGDVIYSQTTHGNVISIFSNCENGVIITYADLFLKSNNFFHEKELLYEGVSTLDVRLATSNEKAVLFDRIKIEGYQWNTETKQIEKLFVPKNGDIICGNGEGFTLIGIFHSIENNKIYCYCEIHLKSDINYFYRGGYTCYTSEMNNIRLATLEEKTKLFKKIANNFLVWNFNTKTLDSLYQPKNGDVIYIKEHDGTEWISIFNEINNNLIFTYCDKSSRGNIDLFTNESSLMDLSVVKELRLATENEKSLLFDALSKKSLIWDSETKSLDKIYNPMDGDFVFISENGIYANNYIAIYKNKVNDNKTYCCLNIKDDIFDIRGTFDSSRSIRKATEDEKNRLLKAIESEGLVWNSSTKNLDKKFVPKNGDIIRIDSIYLDSIIAIFNKSYVGYGGLTYNACYCCFDEDGLDTSNNINFDAKKLVRLATEEEKQKLFDVIKENELSWNAETKTLDPLKELIEPNKGDYVFIKTRSYSYICIFNNKDMDRIWTFGHFIISESCYDILNMDSYFSNSQILEMRLATNSEIKEFNKQLISQDLMWNPYLKKCLVIPKRGDLCIFYDKFSLNSIRLELFSEFDDNWKPVGLNNIYWDFCIPYNEKLYKQMIDFK